MRLFASKCCALAAALFGLITSVKAETIVPIIGSHTQNNTAVGFEGMIAYDSALQRVTVSLTNTSNVFSVITGFLFNIAGDVTASYTPANDAATVGVDEGAWAYEDSNLNGQSVTGPFGTWDAGAALLILAKQQAKGIDTGETGVFIFNLTGPDAGLLTASSFTTELNSGAGLSSYFLARFQSVERTKSDRMVAASPVVPMPAAVWSGMALCGVIGAARMRHRLRQKSMDA